MGDKLRAQKDITLESPQWNKVYSASDLIELMIPQYLWLSYMLNRWQHNWIFIKNFPIFYYPLQEDTSINCRITK